MAALTANADRKRSPGATSRVGSKPVAASTQIYKHSLVSVDGSGNMITTKSTSNNCVGFSRKQYDNSSGSAGDLTAEYHYLEEVEITGSSVTAGHIHRTLYAKDDNLVVPTSTTGPAVGLLTNLVGTTCTVMVGLFQDESY